MNPQDGDKAVELYHVPVGDIDTFTIDIDRDIRRRCFAARFLVCVGGSSGYNDLYTPLSMELKRIPNGLQVARDMSAIRLEEQHAKHIGEELVRANVVLESKEEKDRRIEDMKTTIRLLEERVKFFENMMYNSIGMKPEDIEKLRLIRDE